MRIDDRGEMKRRRGARARELVTGRKEGFCRQGCLSLSICAYLPGYRRHVTYRDQAASWAPDENKRLID